MLRIQITYDIFNKNRKGIVLMATIKDVAAAAGVSTATVSRAFSNKNSVNNETRNRILEEARKLNFTPREYKQRSNSLGCGCIGVVVPDISNNFFAEVISGIESVMSKLNIQVLICNSDEDPGAEIKILDSLQAINVCGIIIAPVSNAVEYNAECLKNFDRSGIPVVLMDRDLRNGSMDGVFMDSYGGAYEATQTLINCGHKDIAFICGPLTSSSGLDRLNAFIAAHRDNGLEVHEEHIIYSDFKYETTYNLITQRIDQMNKVTAILSSNRRMTYGCCMALSENRIVIGRDVSFISCGRPEIGHGFISYVDYPTYDMGSECAQILIEKAKRGKRNRTYARKRTTFDMELILNGSEKYPSNR